MLIPFYFSPSVANKREQNRSNWNFWRVSGSDLLVLARYMQILSPEFTAGYRNRIINIHHSFLPAFYRSQPLSPAYRARRQTDWRTSHYVNGAIG